MQASWTLFNSQILLLQGTCLHVMPSTVPILAENYGCSRGSRILMKILTCLTSTNWRRAEEIFSFLMSRFHQFLVVWWITISCASEPRSSSRSLSKRDEFTWMVHSKFVQNLSCNYSQYARFITTMLLSKKMIWIIDFFLVSTVFLAENFKSYMRDYSSL